MPGHYTWTTFPLPNVANFNTIARATLEEWRANSALMDADQVADESDIDALQTSVGALTAGSGVVISDDDTAVGYLDGKLVAGDGITLTVGNDGGDETLTVAADPTAILPDQTDNSGKYLTTDGSNASWAAIPDSGVSLNQVLALAIIMGG